jgi:hypothetical protein
VYFLSVCTPIVSVFRVSSIFYHYTVYTLHYEQPAYVMGPLGRQNSRATCGTSSAAIASRTKLAQTMRASLRVKDRWRWLQLHRRYNKYKNITVRSKHHHKPCFATVMQIIVSIRAGRIADVLMPCDLRSITRNTFWC